MLRILLKSDLIFRWGKVYIVIHQICSLDWTLKRFDECFSFMKTGNLHNQFMHFLRGTHTNELHNYTSVLLLRAIKLAERTMNSARNKLLGRRIKLWCDKRNRIKRNVPDWFKVGYSGVGDKWKAVTIHYTLKQNSSFL